jgi:Protein of unknown function (DUF3568)
MPSASRLPLHFACISLLVTATLLTASCTRSAKSGTPYTFKLDQELEAHINSDLQTVHGNAAIVLKQDYGFTIVKETIDILNGYLEAKTVKDDVVRVETYREGANATKIEVFIGPMGNEPLANQIFTAIEARCKSQIKPQQ